MRRKNFIIGSRGSDLALWQTNFVKSELEKYFPEIKLEIKIIHTTGDQILDIALAKIGDKGLFTKQIESALLNNEIDLAVHSLKDLQTTQPDGLKIGAVSARETSNDILISKNHLSIDELPQNAKVATGSLRRKSQLLNYRPDLQLFEIRGNVPTRLRKFAESDLDAMILAYAGVHRLNLDEHISQIIPFQIMLPAVGQGAMAIEIRNNDTEIADLLKPLNDVNTNICITAERAFLRNLEGGCQFPIGANAVIENGKIHLEGFVGSLNGEKVLRESIIGNCEEAENLGIKLAEIFIVKGANEILERTHQKVQNSVDEVI